MPLYKLTGNRVLTAVENRMVGTNLSEWHSGYRAYSVAALRELPFERNDDDFNFDTQIIIQLAEAGKRIVEVPIPTFYGDEICYVNGLRYARLICRDVLRYRAHKLGFGTGELAFASQTYESKHAPDSSHGRILQWLAERPTGRMLDLGCGDGYLAGQLRSAGHHVVGVDAVVTDGVKDRVDEFIQADLDLGLPPEVTGPFDVVIAADVLEHVRRPEVVLDELHRVVDPSGIVVASVPNFAHWYPRVRVLTGRFDYDRRGILDRTHVRFFTRGSFERLLAEHGWRVVRRAHTGLPFDVTARGQPNRAGTGDGGPGIVQRIDSAAVRVRPTLFAYQFLYQLVPDRRRRP
jgi:methionine biosynthesis protein MetW